MIHVKRLTRSTLWFADLWPSDRIASIYQRFIVLGVVIGIVLTHRLSL